ncbi:helix-turn-helix domain-containing protein [Kitasatospora sp. NPDC004240]
MRPGVAGYGGYRLTGEALPERVFAPSGRVTVFIALEGRMSAGHCGLGPDAVRTGASAVYGPHVRPKVLGHPGAVEGVEISMLPWAARSLFGVPTAELADLVADADALLGNRLPALAQALGEVATWPARFAVLDRALLRWTAARAGRAPRPDPSVLHAWDLLARSAGAMPIRELAARTAWSERRLEIRFREHVGLTPKRLARALRLERALGLLTGGSSQADTALACGFFDQSHLAREFTALTGMPPGRLLAATASGRCVWPVL